jgi:predicted transport protein
MAATTSDAATQTMIKNLPGKTGKSLQQWLTILQRAKLEKHGEMIKYLKTGHGVTHGFANLIAHQFRAGNAGADADPVGQQYAGARAGLRPLYDKLIALVTAFGNDVEIAPKKTYVSLRRNKQFAIVQPSTKDRVDVGINLKGEKPTARLENSGSFNAMVSHRVRITDKKQIDAELKTWLKRAYDAA